MYKAPPIYFRPASFHDDLMIPTSADAGNIIHKTMQYVTVALYVFNLFGLQLICSSNKSEGVVRFNGSVSARAKRNLNKCNNKVDFTLLNGQKSDSRFVQSYKYVGTETSVSSNMAEEVVLRSCIMTTDAKGLNKRVFKKINVNTCRKLLVAKTYLLTKGFFQCGTWPSLPTIVLHKFSSSIMQVYRMALQCNKPDDRISDADIFIEQNAISPIDILRYARVAILTRILTKQVTCGIDMIVSMAQISSGWAHDMFLDFRWVALHEVFAGFRDIAPRQICDLLIHDNKSYSNNT